jgi:hypothetical protein
MKVFKNIHEALLNDRPNDKIVKVLSNKFAIVQSVFTNGEFDTMSLCELNNGVIYFRGHEDKKGGFGWLKNYMLNYVHTKPNFDFVLIGYNHLPCMVRKTTSLKKIKKSYKKALHVLSANNI